MDPPATFVSLFTTLWHPLSRHCYYLLHLGEGNGRKEERRGDKKERIQLTPCGEGGGREGGEGRRDEAGRRSDTKRRSRRRRRRKGRRKMNNEKTEEIRR